MTPRDERPKCEECRVVIDSPGYCWDCDPWPYRKAGARKARLFTEKSGRKK